MKKCRYKAIPYDSYDKEYLALWLEEQAQKGRIVRSFEGGWAKFSVEEPQSIRYYAEPTQSREKEPESEELRLYREYGWEFLGKLRYGAFVYQTRDREAREIHTDPKVQAMTWKRLIRSHTCSYAWWIALMVLLIWSHFVWVPQQNDGALWMLEKGIAAQIGQWCVYVSLSLMLTVQYIQRLRWYRQLKRGETLDKGRLHRSMKGRKVLYSILSAACVCWVLSAIVHDSWVTITPIAEYQQPLPMVRLEEIAPSPLQPYADLHGDLNYVTIRRDLGVVKLEASQYKTLPGDKTNYFNSIEYYEVWSDEFAQKAFGERLEELKFKNKLESIEIAQMDEAYFLTPQIARDRQEGGFAFRQGNRWLITDYGGKQDIRSFAEEYGKVFAQYRYQP